MANGYGEGDLASVLKPFHDRAKLAEDRLETLESSLKTRHGSALGIESELRISVTELRKELETTRAEQLAEREKAAKEMAVLASEKEKLKYQIVHLKRSLREADQKLLLSSTS